MIEQLVRGGRNEGYLQV